MQKSSFGLRQLDIGFPELRIAPIANVGAQEIGAFRGAAPSSNDALQETTSRNAAGQASGSKPIAKQAAARWFCCRMWPICRFSGAGSRRFFSLLRRSAERDRITVSAVSG
jgi:hypothetical protein